MSYIYSTFSILTFYPLFVWVIKLSSSHYSYTRFGAIADWGAYTGVTAKWLHTKDPKPQKQRVKVKRKPKERHLRTLQHSKAKSVTAKKAAVKPKSEYISIVHS